MGLPWSYTADANFVATVSFTYSISDQPSGHWTYTDYSFDQTIEGWEYDPDDGTYGSSSATITIDVIDGTPCAANDYFATYVNAALTENVLSNDPLTVTSAWANHGLVGAFADGSFVYIPNQDFSGTDQIYYYASDAYHSSLAQATITVNPVNDAPVVSGAANFSAIDEDQVSNSGNLVSTLLNGHVADADSNALRGIALTALASGSGTWQYSTDAGSTWANVGTVSDTSALLLRSLDKLRLVPDTHNGTTASVTFRAWDQTSGAYGTKANVSTNGGITAISSATATSTINVSSVNDAPHNNGASNFTTITEDDTTNTGDLVSTLIAGHITDVDAGAISGIAITASSAGNGTWQYQLAGGTWTNLGTPSGQSALLLSPTDSLRFVPNTYTGTSAALSFSAWDQSNNLAALSHTTISSVGGDTAYSTATAVASITVTDVNDAPHAANDGPFSFDSSLASTYTIDAADGVLANDTDVDPGDTRTAVLDTQPSHGTVNLNSDGSFAYTPNHSYAGSDSFTYHARDAAGAASNIATVSFTVSNTRDVQITGFTADGTYLLLSYTVAGGNVSPFYIGLYASPNGTSVVNQLESITADGTAGTHSLSIVPYFSDPSGNYYLLAQVDGTDAINETNESNNVAVLAGGSFVLDDSTGGDNVLEVQQNTNDQAVTLSTDDGTLTLGSKSLTDVSHTLSDEDDGTLGDLDVTGDTTYGTDEDGNPVINDHGTVDLLDAQTIAFDIVHTDRLWQTPDLRWDVNHDGEVAPNDLTALISVLNGYGATLLDHPRGTSGFLGGTTLNLDVSGDNVVSESDMLDLIDYLNGGSGTHVDPHQNADNSLDVNGDSVVNDDDEQAVLSYLAGIASSGGSSMTYDVSSSASTPISSAVVRTHGQSTTIAMSESEWEAVTPYVGDDTAIDTGDSGGGDDGGDGGGDTGDDPAAAWWPQFMGDVGGLVLQRQVSLG
jgi:Big-like domain-containing protein